MKTGDEYKGEWGDTVLVLRAIQQLNIVYFMDEIFFVDKLPTEEFNMKFKPTGRVNLALKNVFNERNFERKGNESDTSSLAPHEGIQGNYKL